VHGCAQRSAEKLDRSRLTLHAVQNGGA
jgi:hypothetical protein